MTKKKICKICKKRKHVRQFNQVKTVDSSIEYNIICRVCEVKQCGSIQPTKRKRCHKCQQLKYPEGFSNYEYVCTACEEKYGDTTTGTFMAMPVGSIPHYTIEVAQILRNIVIAIGGQKIGPHVTKHEADIILKWLRSAELEIPERKRVDPRNDYDKWKDFLKEMGVSYHERKSLKRKTKAIGIGVKGDSTFYEFDKETGKMCGV